MQSAVQRITGIIGIERGQLPQRLLPPHRADEETAQPVAYVTPRALARDGSPRIERSDYAADEQQPVNDRRPGGTHQEVHRIGEWIRCHDFPSVTRSCIS